MKLTLCLLNLLSIKWLRLAQAVAQPVGAGRNARHPYPQPRPVGAAAHPEIRAQPVRLPLLFRQALLA